MYGSSVALLRVSAPFGLALKFREDSTIGVWSVLNSLVCCVPDYSSLRMPIVHMVWFKTKEPLTAENWKELHEAANNLRTIPGVISVELGSFFLLTLGRGARYVG